MRINSLVSPLSCDLKLINGKSLNKCKTKTTNTKWIKSEPIIWTLSAGISEPLKFSIIGNYCYVKLLADSLLEHGLDEVLVFTGGEELEGLSPGWLPLHGSDLVKASRAYASLGTYAIYERRPPNWRVYMPWIYTYEGKVFIEWPGMSSCNVYKLMLVRLADASLGEPFTSDIEFGKVDTAILDIFRKQFVMDYSDIPRRGGWRRDSYILKA